DLLFAAEDQVVIPTGYGHWSKDEGLDDPAPLAERDEGSEDEEDDGRCEADRLEHDSSTDRRPLPVHRPVGGDEQDDRDDGSDAEAFVNPASPFHVHARRPSPRQMCAT